MELPDLSLFTHIQTYENRFGLRMPITGASASFYEKKEGEKIISVALYSINGKKVYTAWGDKDVEHCESHALLFTNPVVIHPGCVNFVKKDQSIIFTEGSKTCTYNF